MGLTMSSVKPRRKETPYEILRKSESEIKINERIVQNMPNIKKRGLRYFTCLSTFAYFLAIIFFFTNYYPTKISKGALYILFPPLLISFVRKVIIWYCNRRIKQSREKIPLLQDKRKKALNDVIGKIVNKVATPILEKFVLFHREYADLLVRSATNGQNSEMYNHHYVTPNISSMLGIPPGLVSQQMDVIIEVESFLACLADKLVCFLKSKTVSRNIHSSTYVEQRPKKEKSPMDILKETIDAFFNGLMKPFQIAYSCLSPPKRNKI